jgi:glycosyltransferase involved in cell wall biosynthesis
MPSYLGEYRNAAKNRDAKIVRAVDSVLAQTYKDWELQVIADGCTKTIEILKQFKDTRIKTHYIQKQPIWSGAVRNKGLDEATGEYSLYLDIDDAFHIQHLEEISTFIDGKDWYWFDDYVWNGKEFRFRKCDVNKMGRCGTCNVIHKTDLARWKERDGYAHDWNFINALKKQSRNYDYIRAGKYLVCHIPGRRTEI